VNTLVLQMAIATIAGPIVAWRVPSLRLPWPSGLAAYTAAVVVSHVGPSRESFAGGVLLAAGAVALCAGMRSIAPAGWFLYLFAAMPPMDLVAAWFLSTGRGDLGVVMIIFSLPVGIASLAAAWRWMLEEESHAT
jgi:hypothetical protein